MLCGPFPKGCAVLLLGAFTLLGQSEAPDPEAVFEQGQRALSLGQYATAETQFRRLLAQGVRSAAVFSNLGVAYLRTGKLDPAIEAFRQARKLAPQMTGVDLNLGLAYYRKHEFKEATGYFAAVLNTDPANVQAHYLKGVCHFMMDEFGPAVDAFLPIIDRERDDLEYLFMLGISYGKLKKNADSERIFARLIVLGGDSPHLHLLLGKARMALEDYEKAREELARAAAAPDLPYAHYYLGILDERQGKVEQATAEFLKEIQITPSDLWAYEELTKIKLEKGDITRAIALLEKAIRLNPAEPKLMGSLAKAYLQKSEPQRAVPLLKSAIELEPNNAGFHYQIGRAYLKAGTARGSRNRDVQGSSTAVPSAGRANGGALPRTGDRRAQTSGVG